MASIAFSEAQALAVLSSSLSLSPSGLCFLLWVETRNEYIFAGRDCPDPAVLVSKSLPFIVSFQFSTPQVVDFRGEAVDLVSVFLLAEFPSLGFRDHAKREFVELGEEMILAKQYRCIHSASCQCTKGHLSEDAIYLVFQQLKWNPKLIATLSSVCKWFDDLAKRVLWKEFCLTRAPKMMVDLQSSGSHSVDGNWRALAKLLIYCSGCKKDGLFNNIQIPGHFVYRTRFSRTSGKSFLLPQCRSDVLYVSDPCEHLDQGDEGDIGFFRGVFKTFSTSKVRKMLIKKGAKLHPTEVCPYCKAKLWNMLHSKMIPQSASCRLGAYEDCIEYYVCLNGHVLGLCTLLPLSDSEEASELE